VWQALREELYPQGLEIVTVALDTLGEKAAREFIEKANPTHPSLIDEGHLLDELYGIINVPSGVWIDEEGMIVRPAERAGVPRGEVRPRPIPEDASDYTKKALTELNKMIEVGNIRKDTEKYIPAIRDWVANGAKSRYALAPDEVLERSRPRPLEEASAAAYFELGQHLYRAGKPDLAVPHFREAHRLQPENWTYKRQAWSMADPTQGPTDLYEGSWADDVAKFGAENYYAPLQMD
jgi:tetratricopeptide (TPR) repeat protein